MEISAPWRKPLELRALGQMVPAMVQGVLQGRQANATPLAADRQGGEGLPIQKPVLLQARILAVRAVAKKSLSIARQAPNLIP